MGFLDMLSNITNPIGTVGDIAQFGINLFNNRKMNRRYKDLEEQGKREQKQYQSAWKRGDLKGDTTQVGQNLQQALMNQGGGMAGRLADANLNRIEQRAVDSARSASSSGSVAQAIAQAMTTAGERERARALDTQLAEFQRNQDAVRMARRDMTSQQNKIVEDNKAHFQDLRDQGKANQFAGMQGSYNMNQQLGGMIGGGLRAIGNGQFGQSLNSIIQDGFGTWSENVANRRNSRDS